MEDSLFKETEIVGTEPTQDALIIAENGDDLVTEVIKRQPSKDLTDLRTQAMTLPVEQLKGALLDYQERRQTFSEWLLHQMTEGVHYGFPPDCKPKTNENGDILQWKKNKSGSGGNYVVIDKAQWQAKPSLYKAGADLVIDLMGVRPKYSADMDAWAQAGSKAGLYTRKCELYSKDNGALIGEGAGAFVIGEKGMYENSALKMANKRARVDAVLNTWGLSDLFTQDLEDPDWIPDEHKNPKEGESPQVPGRDDGMSKQEGTDLFNAWKRILGSREHESPTVSHFRAWASGVLQTDENLGDAHNWNQAMLRACYEKLGEYK